MCPPINRAHRRCLGDSVPRTASYSVECQFIEHVVSACGGYPFIISYYGTSSKGDQFKLDASSALVFGMVSNGGDGDRTIGQMGLYIAHGHYITFPVNALKDTLRLPFLALAGVAMTCFLLPSNRSGQGTAI